MAALGGLLFGYDTAVISGAIGFLARALPSRPAVVEGLGGRLCPAGLCLGAALAGMLSDRFGRKGMLIARPCCSWSRRSAPPFPRLTQFIFFRMIGGLGIGAASMTSPMYIAEVAPARIRGQMVSVNQFAIVTGMLVVYFVNYFIAQYGTAADQASGVADGSWNALYGWRWMFGSGILPSGLFLLLLLLVPESPRWLVKENRPAEALAILSRVGGGQHARDEMAEIQAALAQETGTLAQLFQPGMRIVLVIGVTLAVLQQVSGINVFLYFAPEIFKKLGSGSNVALMQTVIVGGVNLAFTVLAIWTVDRLGRKPLMLVGSAGMGICLLALGLAAYWQRTELWTIVFHSGLHRLFCPLGGTGDVGDSVGDLSHRHPRPGDGAGHHLPLGGQLLRDPDLHLDGRKSLADRTLPPRVPVLGLCRVLRAERAFCLALRARNQGQDAGRDRTELVEGRGAGERLIVK